MPPPGRALPRAAQGLARTLTAAVSAAQADDPDALAEAGERASRLDVETVRLVLGAVVRDLVEHAHPDGIGADDVGDLVRECVRTAAPWWPDLHADVLVAVLAGSLGVHPDSGGPEGGEGPDASDGGGAAPRPSPTEQLLGAALLAARLLPPDGDVTPFVHAAFAELARAETVELP